MYLPDLTPFPGKSEAHLGMNPLAVGWLRADKPYTTGSVPAEFTAKLLVFCYEAYSLPGGRRSGRCALSRDCPRFIAPVEQGEHVAYFDGELRVIGDEDIFAAPALIHHYVTVHNYRPPAEFIDAVLHGAEPGSPAHRALIRTLRGER